MKRVPGVRARLAEIEWRAKVRWFAAEYLIVVLGVLTAVGINAWWGARQDAAAEARALKRLAAESEEIVRYHRDRIERVEASLQRLESDVAVVVSDVATAFAPATEGGGLWFVLQYPAVTPPRSVYDEITGSGRFGDLSSVEVRSALSAYYAELDFIQSQLAFFRQGSEDAIEALRPGLALAYDPDSERRVRGKIDLALLRQDEEAKQVLLGALRNQTVFQSYRRSVYEAAVSMCRALSEATGGTCQAARADGSVPAQLEDEAPGRDSAE